MQDAHAVELMISNRILSAAETAEAR